MPHCIPQYRLVLICLSLETYVYLLCHRVVDPSTIKYYASYKSILVADQQQTLEVPVLPKCCLELTLKTIAANPFAHTGPRIAHSHEPYGVICSLCLGDN
jgi:hypothetical protein